MKTESNKEIAERITETAHEENYSLVDWRKAIEVALDARDERAAKIARNKWMEMSALDSVESEHYARAGREIAAAIDGGKCPHGIYSKSPTGC